MNVIVLPDSQSKSYHTRLEGIAVWVMCPTEAAMGGCRLILWADKEALFLF